jgi:ParB-like nuclease domain
MNPTNSNRARQTKFARLPVDALFVDRTAYQRELKPKNVARITRVGWSERRAGTIAVSDRGDGTYAVYDGQHRLEAACILGVRDVACMVTTGMTRQEEAQAFIDCNRDRQQPDWYDYLHAMVGAKDAEAIAILETVQRHGLSVGKGGNPNMIQAPRTLMDVSSVFGLKTLDHTLRVLKEIWHGEAESLKAGFIGAMARVLVDYKLAGLDEERLVAILSRTPTGEVLRLAKAMSTKFSVSDESIGRAFVTLYNKRLRAGSMLDLSIISTRSAAVKRAAQKQTRYTKKAVKEGRATGAQALAASA